MDYMTDVRDWLGGWPMEYAADQDVVNFLEGKFNFKLEKIRTGEACSEFLFRKMDRHNGTTDLKTFKLQAKA